MLVDPPLLESVVELLQKCRHTKDQSQALQVLIYVAQHGLETSTFIGNYLVPMLIDCGCLHDAQITFGKLSHRSEHSWTSLLCGYIECGTMQYAFALYHKMLQNQIYISTHTYMALLQACLTPQNLDKGRCIHREIINKGLEKDVFLGNALVDMYGKLGFPLEAQQVFCALSFRDRVSWNSMIGVHVEYGLGEESLHCIEHMQLENITPDAISMVWCLKACSIIQSIEKGQLLCAEIVQKGFSIDLRVATAMVDMYAKCGWFAESEAVLLKMHLQSVIAWTALISAYTEYGLNEAAVSLSEEMHFMGISPNEKTFACILKACGGIGSAPKCQQMHIEVTKRGFEVESFVANALVGMYGRFCLLVEAQEVFKKLPAVDTISWAALVAGYNDHGLAEDTITCLECMHKMGISPSSTIFFSCLKACGMLGVIKPGQGIHSEITKKGLEQDVAMGCTLVSMYAKCGFLVEACQVSDSIPLKHAVSWNALLMGYCGFGSDEDVLHALTEMQSNGFSKDVISLTCSLNACSNRKTSQECLITCIEIITKGLERDISLGSAMVDALSKCGLLPEANHLVERLLACDTITWNALILGYVEVGWSEEAVKCFERMQREGISPNVNSFSSILKACANLRDLRSGQKVYTEIVRKGLDSKDFNGSTLIDMYFKCGSLMEARSVFDMLETQDEASWASLISGYSEYGFDEEVLKCYEEMQLEKMPIDSMTIVWCLKACTTIGSLDTGKAIHTKCALLGLESNVFVGNTLIDLYGKCGLPEEARTVFDKLPSPDVVSWGALIKAYAENHDIYMAAQCFSQMQGQGVKPDAITFTCLLAACSHSSEPLQCEEYFKLMVQHKIRPTLDHFTCIIDLFVRIGYFSMAENYNEALECNPSKEVRTAVLNACQVYGKLAVGLRSFGELVGANDGDALAFC